jgi:hypothetical protein
MDQILFEAPGCPSLRLRFDTTTLIKDDKKAGSSCPRGGVQYGENGHTYAYTSTMVFGTTMTRIERGAREQDRNGVTVIH